MGGIRSCTLAVVLLVAGAKQASAQFVDLTQWTIASGGNGHWYAITTHPDDWRNVEGVAASFGGYLTSITSAAENNWVYDTFINFGTCAPNWCDPATFYIGLERASPGGPFAWVSGEPLGFTAWHAGEPNNEGGVEGSTQMFKTGGLVVWNDIDFDSNPMVGVVEWDTAPPLSTVPEPPTIALLAIGLAGIVATRAERSIKLF